MPTHRHMRHHPGLVRQTLGAWAILAVTLAVGLGLASFADHRPPQERLTLPQWRGSPSIGSASDDEPSEPVITGTRGIDGEPDAARDGTPICQMSPASAVGAERSAAQPYNSGSEAPC